jgi:hypothetical protein
MAVQGREIGERDLDGFGAWDTELVVWAIGWKTMRMRLILFER